MLGVISKRKAVKKIILTIFILVVIAICVVAILVFTYYPNEWQFVSSKASPNNKNALYLYNNVSDFDRHAPYGQYVFFSQQATFKKASDGHIIFAGYCQEPIEFAWQSNEQINIICINSDSNKIRTSSNKVLGINVNLQTQ